MSNLFYLLQRSYASAALELVKMKALVPCDVDDKFTGYKGRIVELVFDPRKVEETNARFEAAGFHIPADMQVVAVMENGSILMWGGINSLYYLAKGEHLHESLNYNLAFCDVRDLLNPFKLKNKKVELDELIAHLRAKYGKK
jgi:hypothetical protein